MCLGVDLFLCISFAIYCIFWIWEFMFVCFISFNFWKFLAKGSSNPASPICLISVLELKIDVCETSSLTLPSLLISHIWKMIPLVSPDHFGIISSYLSPSILLLSSAWLFNSSCVCACVCACICVLSRCVCFNLNDTSFLLRKFHFDSLSDLPGHFLYFFTYYFNLFYCYKFCVLCA